LGLEVGASWLDGFRIHRVRRTLEGLLRIKHSSEKLAISLTVLYAALFLLPIVEAQRQQDDRALRMQEVNELPAKAKRFALVIGVDEYQDTQISRLSGAANDAKSLADALVRSAGFPQNQVILLASDQPAERQPTRGNILRRLSNLRGEVPEDGLLLVSFAGHGIERGGRGFLCTSDAQINGDLALLEDTAIAVETMHERIRQMGVKQVLIVLDACRNDPSGRGEKENRLTDSFAQKFNFDVRNQEVTAFATLYATDVGHVAYEYKEKKQGYFTWTLVEGLKGGAANERGEVTLGGLVKYLQERVPKQVRLDLGQEKSQKPYARTEGYKADELVISITVRVPTVTSTVSALDPAAIELELWSSIKSSADPDDFKAYLEKYPNGTFAGVARNRIRQLDAAAKPAPTNESKKPVTNDDSTRLSLTVVGEWVGEWRDSGGNLFICEVRITESSTGLSGSIIWNLKRSPRPDLQSKIGLSAVEYVRGTYEPSTRAVDVEGYRKDDPNIIIDLDRYKLLLSADGQTLSGQTYTQGTWEGRFLATRKK
jgi:uncharacterized caspase-like protein